MTNKAKDQIIYAVPCIYLSFPLPLRAFSQNSTEVL